MIVSGPVEQYNHEVGNFYSGADSLETCLYPSILQGIIINALVYKRFTLNNLLSSVFWAFNMHLNLGASVTEITNNANAAFLSAMLLPHTYHKVNSFTKENT